MTRFFIVLRRNGGRLAERVVGFLPSARRQADPAFGDAVDSATRVASGEPVPPGIDRETWELWHSEGAPAEWLMHVAQRSPAFLRARPVRPGMNARRGAASDGGQSAHCAQARRSSVAAQDAIPVSETASSGPRFLNGESESGRPRAAWPEQGAPPAAFGQFRAPGPAVEGVANFRKPPTMAARDDTPRAPRSCAVYRADARPRAPRQPAANDSRNSTGETMAWDDTQPFDITAALAPDRRDSHEEGSLHEWRHESFVSEPASPQRGAPEPARAPSLPGPAPNPPLRETHRANAPATGTPSGETHALRSRAPHASTPASVDARLAAQPPQCGPWPELPSGPASELEEWLRARREASMIRALEAEQKEAAWNVLRF